MKQRNSWYVYSMSVITFVIYPLYFIATLLKDLSTLENKKSNYFIPILYVIINLILILGFFIAF